MMRSEIEIPKPIVYVILIYIVLQLGGLNYIATGMIEFRSYILGWITGALAGILLVVIFIVAFMGNEANRILQKLFSKLI